MRSPRSSRVLLSVLFILSALFAAVLGAHAQDATEATATEAAAPADPAATEAAAPVAPAVQVQSPSISAIVRFTSSVTSARLADIEDGNVTTTLSWHIVNVQAGQRVALDYAVQNGWLSLLTEGEALSPVGEREVTLRDPLSFGPPTFRLTLISGRAVADQQYLTIPITAEAGETPEIVSFTTETPALDPAAVEAGNTRLVVSWDVANRIPDTNLVFEQVLRPGETRSAELPRPTLYVFSTGSGPVALVNPPEDQPAVIRLRLSVVNVITGDIYDTAELEISVGAFNAAGPDVDSLITPPATTPVAPADTTLLPAVSPTSALDPQGTLIPTAALLPEGTAQLAPGEATAVEAPPAAATPIPSVQQGSGTASIRVFTVSPTTTAPGSNVTISWNVESAATVQIQEVLADGTIGITYVSLPALGAISVPVPASGAPAFVYRLTATDANGGTVTQDVPITIQSA